MVKRDYRRALKAAERDLIDLIKQKEVVTRKIAETRQTILALRTTVETDHERNIQSWRPKALTDAVVFALMKARRPLVPVEVRDEVDKTGFENKSSNPLASVHSVLRRLRQQELVIVPCEFDRNLGHFHPLMNGYWWAEYKLPKGWVNPTPQEYDATGRKLFPDWDEWGRNKSRRKEIPKKAQA